MKEAMAFWLAASLVGAAAFPLTFAFFSRLPDRGYAFSRVVGLLLLGYTLWIGATAGVFQNSRGSIILLLVLLAIASLAAVRGRRAELAAYFRTGWRYVLFVELFFVAVFATAVTLRSFAPEIQWGEKPFELAFLSSVSRDATFPPADPWFSGDPISYYYFGYVMMSTLTNLTGLGTNVTFYLSLSLVAALAATAIFGVVYNLIAVARREGGDEPAGPRLWPRAVAFGMVASGLLLLLSNLEGVFEMMARHGIGSDGFYAKLGIYGLDGPYDCQAAPGDCAEPWPTRFWWWWKATRIGSAWDIQEFPFFSFHFGDLHPHVIGLPFVITAVAIALQFFRSEEKLDAGWPLRHPWAFLFAGLFIGGLGFINLWDLPTFFLLVVAGAFVANWLRRGAAGWGTLGETLGFAAPLAVLCVLMYVPFYLTFDTGTNGLKPIEASHAPLGIPAESVVTRPLHLLLFWTPLLWVGLPFAASRLLRREDGPLNRPQRLVAVLPWLAPVVLWLAWVTLRVGPGGLVDEIDARGANVLTVAMLALAVALASAAFARELYREGGGEERRRAYAFALLALGGGLLLILGPELFFVDDVNKFRPNTVFKLWFQAWMLLSIGGAFGLYHLTRHWRLPDVKPGEITAETWLGAGLTAGALVTFVGLLPPLSDAGWVRFAGLVPAAAGAVYYVSRAAADLDSPGLTAARMGWLVVTVVVIAAGLVYTFAATMERTGGLANARRMDGYANVQFAHPGEYAAIRWLNDNVRGQPLMVEAIDGSYKDGGRISARTGIPTVLGWPGHETIWGRDNAEVARREADVRLIYESEDAEEARQLIEKYDVEYVYVGWLERAIYAAPDGDVRRFGKFDRFMSAVFRNDEVVIYRMTRPPLPLAVEAR
jgi:YYY domain-containing protein